MNYAEIKENAKIAITLSKLWDYLQTIPRDEYGYVEISDNIKLHIYSSGTQINFVDPNNNLSMGCIIKSNDGFNLISSQQLGHIDYSTKNLYEPNEFAFNCVFNNNGRFNNICTLILQNLSADVYIKLLKFAIHENI